MRAIWSGSIAFGLVNIPVKLYSAVSHQSMGFRLLCKKCHTPVKYKRHCPGCEEDVAWDDTVKGLEIAKGEFLVFTKEELEKIKPEKSDQIEIEEFVDLKEIDPIYYNKPYFIAPAKAKEKAYFLFKEVLKTSDKVAIGRFVMREKEYISAIRDFDNGLILSTLNYKYEVRDVNDIKQLEEPPRLNKKELELAISLVNQLYEEEFHVEKFKDTFAEQLKKMMEKKEKTYIEEPKAESTGKGKSLMDALKASLEQ
ncbi:MAG: Ku protein [Bacteroidia bacterium]